jgi:hypothetical protein
MKLKKKWLNLAAGLMWTAVGLVLFNYAGSWLHGLQPATLGTFLIPGLFLAGLIYQLGFSRLAEENIRRIRNLTGEKQLIFRFQKWSNYPLIVVMITLGMYLRKYSPIPKPVLAGLYIGIGGGLFAASFHYYQAVWRE